MSSSISKDKEILITFGELKQLEVDEIAAFIDQYEALSICEKSDADSTEIFNIWVQKLFKAYDVSKFKKSDWLKIMDFLEKVLNTFIQDLSTLKDETLIKQQLSLWWTDTLELLKWMESVINQIDVQVLTTILNFALDVIVKTSIITDNRNIQTIIMIHEKILYFLTNHILKTDIQNTEDFQAFQKVLLSTCDVAGIISTADIKISIETWRCTAKLANKCNEYYKEMDKISKTDRNEMTIQCSEKPIRGILNELKKLFQYFVGDDASLNNNNFLKVAQFYLKLLKIIMQNSVHSFDVVKEFFALYTLCMHQLKKKNEKKVMDFLHKDLHVIMHMLYERTDIEEYICEHLLNDNRMGEGCHLIMDYMEFFYGHDGGKHMLSVATASRIFDIVFDGHLIFSDNEKYSKVILYYVALTAEDATSEFHMKLCNNVMEYSWTKAYVSYEILGLYYSQCFKAKSEKSLACLEFWIKCWQKFNGTSSILNTLGPQKILIEMLLQTIMAIKLPQTAMEQIFKKFQYPEILLLKCGQKNLNLHTYLHGNLKKYLRKMREMNMQRMEYIELLNLLDIWCRNPQFIDVSHVKDDLVQAFLKIFSTTSIEIHKFKTFVNRCFCIFGKLKYNDAHNTILTCLRDNIDKTKAISNVFMLEYLLASFSPNQIKLFLTPELQKLQTFLKDIESKEFDFQTLYDLYGKEVTNSNGNFALNASKRPRLGNDCSISNTKYILNEMLDYSKQLSNISATFDSKDYELLNCIKQNIQKCLLK